MKRLSPSIAWTTLYFFVVTLFWVPESSSQQSRGTRTRPAQGQTRTPVSNPQNNPRTSGRSSESSRPQVPSVGAPNNTQNILRSVTAGSRLPSTPSLPGSTATAANAQYPKCDSGSLSSGNGSIPAETVLMVCCVQQESDYKVCASKLNEMKGEKSHFDAMADDLTEVNKDFGTACGKMRVDQSSCASRLKSCGADSSKRNRGSSRSNDMLTAAVRGRTSGASCPWIMAEGIDRSRDREASLKQDTRDLQNKIIDLQNESQEKEKDAQMKISDLHNKIREAAARAERLNGDLQDALSAISKETNGRYNKLLNDLKKLEAEKDAVGSKRINSAQKELVKKKLATEGRCREVGNKAVQEARRKDMSEIASSQHKVSPVDIWDRAANRNANYQNIGLEAYYWCMENDPSTRQELVDAQVELENSRDALITETNKLEADIATIRAEIEQLIKDSSVAENKAIREAAIAYEQAQNSQLAYQQDLTNLSVAFSQMRQTQQMQLFQLQQQFQQDNMEYQALKARNDYAGDYTTEASFEAFQEASGLLGRKDLLEAKFREECCDPIQKIRKDGRNKPGESYCRSSGRSTGRSSTGSSDSRR